MRRTAAAALCASLSAAPAASLVLDGGIERQSGDGEFVKLDPRTGFALGSDTFDDDNLYAFDEDQSITLDAPIRVDIGGVEGWIAQGTLIASHYVFFDSLHSFQFGHVTFDAPILGVATTAETMSATDHLANTPVIYLSPALRGLESGDHVWIDPDDPAILRVYWAGSSPGDYIRVFTEVHEETPMM